MADTCITFEEMWADLKRQYPETITEAERLAKEMEKEQMAELISKATVKRWLNSIGVYGYESKVDALPTIEAEPVKHGHWRHYEGTLTCLICGAEFDDGIMEYCGDDVPHRCLDCGAIMEEVKE